MKLVFAVAAMSTVFVSAGAEQALLRDELAPMEFMVGSCWQATRPDQSTVVHCFGTIFGGQYVRERMSLIAEEFTHQAEVVYRWNDADSTIRYHYFDSAGHSRDGSVSGEDGRLSYPEETHTDASGRERVYGSYIEFLGDNSYRLVSAELTDRDNPVINVDLEFTRISEEEAATLLATAP